MVEYPGEGHEEQEQDDPLAKDVARGAAREGRMHHKRQTPSSPTDAATSGHGALNYTTFTRNTLFTHLLHSKGRHAPPVIKHCACFKTR